MTRRTTVPTMLISGVIGSLVTLTATAADMSMQQLADAAAEKRAARTRGIDNYVVVQNIMGTASPTYFEAVPGAGDELGMPYRIYRAVSPTELAQRKAGEQSNMTPDDYRRAAQVYAETGEALGNEVERSMSEAGMPPALLSMGGSNPWESLHPADVMLGGAIMLEAQANALEADANEDSAAAAREAAAQAREFFDKAEVRGTESIDGRTAYHARAEDLNYVQPANGQTFTVNAVSMWIDAEQFVPLQFRMEGVAEQGGQSRAISIERMDKDYRTVPGCGSMYEPYQSVMRMAGVLSPSEEAELREAQGQLAEFEKQLASMPAAQRDMIMRQMGPQLDMLRNMVNTGGFEMQIETQEIRCNAGPSEAVEIFSRL